jgi:protein ImuA
MPDQRHVIDELRERIQRIERRPPRADRVVATGWPEIDGLLGGGFPRGALVDLCGSAGSGKTKLALRALARVTAEGALGAYVDGRGELYAPAAAAVGVGLERLLIVRPRSPAGRGGGAGAGGALREALWAAEALLASGAFALVVVDAPAGAGGRVLRGRGGAGGARGATVEAMLRRLRAAAEKGGAASVWLGEPGELRVPGALRLEVAPGTAAGEGPRVRRAGAVDAVDGGRIVHAA